jgi:hypothetical protein
VLLDSVEAGDELEQCDSRASENVCGGGGGVGVEVGAYKVESGGDPVVVAGNRAGVERDPAQFVGVWSDGRATVDNGRARMGALADGCARRGSVWFKPLRSERRLL